MYRPASYKRRGGDKKRTDGEEGRMSGGTSVAYRLCDHTGRNFD